MKKFRKKIKHFPFFIICTMPIVTLILLLLLPSNEQALEYSIQRKISRFTDNSGSINSILNDSYIAEKISCELLLGQWQYKTYRDCITYITIEHQPNDDCSMFLLTIFIQNSVARYSTKRIAKVEKTTNTLVLNLPIALVNSDAFIRLTMIRDERQQLLLIPVLAHSHHKIFFIKTKP
jgi:hypothetical protein